MDEASNTHGVQWRAPRDTVRLRSALWAHESQRLNVTRIALLSQREIALV